MKSFLSYPSEQRSVAQAIYDFLRSIGIQPWFDQKDLIGGQDWDRERKIAQRAADLTFLVLSPETISRPGVIQREVKEILEQLESKPLGHTFLVSLRTHEIGVPPELGKYQYIDFFRSGWQARLARAVRLKLEQLRDTEPAELREFLEAEERARGIQFRALRFNTGAKLQADYFLYQQAGEYWEYVNAEIVSDIVGGFLNSKAIALSLIPGMAPKYWERQVAEHFRRGELVSLRIAAHQYFGSAYPNNGVYTLNFGGADVGKVSLKDLFHYDLDVVQLIIDRCNRAYRGYEPESGPLRYDRSRDPWPLISQWNFSDDGLLINLSEWSELPHALGTNEVVVPWSELKAKVADTYKATPIGQFILSK